MNPRRIPLLPGCSPSRHPHRDRQRHRPVRVRAISEAHYRSRISGPLLDRIDLQIEVPALPETDLFGQAQGESSEIVRTRVSVARERSLSRQHKPNAQLGHRNAMLSAPPSTPRQGKPRSTISRPNNGADQGRYTFASYVRQQTEKICWRADYGFIGRYASQRGVPNEIQQRNTDG